MTHIGLHSTSDVYRSLSSKCCCYSTFYHRHVFSLDSPHSKNETSFTIAKQTEAIITLIKFKEIGDVGSQPWRWWSVFLLLVGGIKDFFASLFSSLFKPNPEFNSNTRERHTHRHRRVVCKRPWPYKERPWLHRKHLGWVPRFSLLFFPASVTTFPFFLRLLFYSLSLAR